MGALGERERKQAFFCCPRLCGAAMLGKVNGRRMLADVLINAATFVTCHPHHPISQRCFKLPEDIWLLKHGHSSLISK